MCSPTRRTRSAFARCTRAMTSFSTAARRPISSVPSTGSDSPRTPARISSAVTASRRMRRAMRWTACMPKPTHALQTSAMTVASSADAGPVWTTRNTTAPSSGPAMTAMIALNFQPNAQFEVLRCSRTPVASRAPARRRAGRGGAPFPIGAWAPPVETALPESVKRRRSRPEAVRGRSGRSRGDARGAPRGAAPQPGGRKPPGPAPRALRVCE